MQLLQIHERVLVLGVQAQHLGERLGRTVDEAASFVVEPQTQEHIRVFELAELRPLKKRLMNRDRFADLTLLAIEVAENHVHFERVGVERGRLGQLVDRQINLIRDQEVEAEQVVRRFARPAPIEELPVAQLVALPGLAHCEPHEQRDKPGEQRRILVHDFPEREPAGRLMRAMLAAGAAGSSSPWDSMSPFQRPCARSTSSMRSRTAPSPPRRRLTKSTRDRISRAASEGQADKPARSTTGRSRTSSPI